MSKRHINRRQFLGEASCATVGSMAFLSSVLNLGAINTLAARPNILGNTGDYKAMVCILLAGGCDTHNVLVPTESSEYASYVATRGSLALSNNANPAQLLPLNYNNGGKTYAVHAGMTRVRDMFDQGDLSFLANIGTLIEPIANKSEYDSGLKKIPLGLYSHSDQIMQWQTSVPQSRSAVGVAGRIADILHDMNTIPEISMNISLSGKNRFQTGNEYNEYSISRSTTGANIGFTPFPSWWSDAGYKTSIKNNAIKSMVEQQYSNVFHETIGTLTKQSIESIEKFRIALENVVPLTTTFSTSSLSQDLKKIAELISVRSFLGASRQIYYVTYGGWDHHDNVIGNQNAMLPVLSNAMAEFNDAMNEINQHDNVVTFTISDFARTLTSNGNGSDHAWGGNHMVMGGPITGSQIYGNYPSLALTNNDFNLSTRGRILPTTSVDEFYAELALWYGVSPNDLGYILPNLCNFYSPTCPADLPTNYMPLGMFS
ncbi:MAG TPA: DUF1501 domain-containing protein [Saprospiraceae bacterium]|nr:DUF1501 domain-containing protein [Saprospiraceae bacterium]